MKSPLLFQIFAISGIFALIGCSTDQPIAFQSQNDFPSATQISARMGHGINVGNALDAPNEGDWGVTLQQDYFQWIADSGFTNVRIPVRWSAHADSAPPYTIDPQFMARVKWAVDEALSHNLIVVLNMHHYIEMMTDPTGQEDRYLSMWAQISKAFQQYPAELLFEPLNEPKDSLSATRWNALLIRAIDVIRATNKSRTLVIGTAEWGGIAGLNSLELPSDTNLIATVHYYEPHRFTHQGAAFEAGADVWLGTTWRATEVQRATLDNDLKIISQWSESHGVPVYLGEFGTIVHVDSTSRAWYTEYITRQLDSLNIPWAMWNFSSDFGIYNDSTQVWNTRLCQALFHPGLDTALESALAQSTRIDLSVYTLLESFDDTLGPDGLTTLGAKYYMAHNIPLDSTKGYWYFYNSPTSYFYNSQGDTLWDYLKVDSGNAYNFASSIENCGNTGKCAHVKAHLVGSSYPYVGFGFGFSAWDQFHNLDSLTAIEFKAKGSGQWWIQLTSDSIMNGYGPDSTWGFFGQHVYLDSTWQTFLIPVSSMIPKPWSPQEADGMVWSDQSNAVSAIEFMGGQSYGATPNEQLEIWIDDIRLIGVTEDLFLP